MNFFRFFFRIHTNIKEVPVLDAKWTIQPGPLDIADQVPGEIQDRALLSHLDQNIFKNFHSQLYHICRHKRQRTQSLNKP